MAKLQLNNDLSNVRTLEDLIRFASIAIKDIYDLVNGNIEFDSNIRSKKITVDFIAANAEQAVRHNLARVPQGYIQTKANAATSIYNTTDSDSNFLYLKSSAVAIVDLEVF